MPPSSPNYGTTRERTASVSFVDIEAAARQLMAAGGYPSVAAVRKALKRGSTTTIAEAMRRFWKNQAALDSGNPVALTRLPPEFADAAVDLWEQALQLSQQTAKSEDNAARARVEQLRRDTDLRVHSSELREKEWDLAARIRERALADAREHVNVLLKELAADRAELRSREARIGDLEAQIEGYRRQLAQLIRRTVVRNRALKTKDPAFRRRKSPAFKTRSRAKYRRPASKRPKSRARR